MPVYLLVLALKFSNFKEIKKGFLDFNTDTSPIRILIRLSPLPFPYWHKNCFFLNDPFKQRLVMENSPIHDSLPLRDSLFPLRDKIQEKKKEQQSQPDASLMLAGNRLLIKECTFYALQQEKDEQGALHFKIAPYQGERPDGKLPPLILVCAGHVYFSKEHATALDEAIVEKQNLDHPVIQIYKERDPFSGETCWHLLEESDLHSFSQKMNLSSNLTSEDETSSSTRPRSAAKPYRASPHKRPMPQNQEQESNTPKPDENSAAAERIFDNNPGSITSVALKSAEWVDKKLITSSEAKKEERQDFLHKANLGEFDELLPLYKNSLSSLDKDEKEEEKNSKPPSSLPEEDRRQIENMRSQFPI